ncbi:MAG: RNA pseudouridine synthase [Bdellovibrionales bacterium]|nr:RNA pseudouridine synthase [Bdellovibrionales bacterium]
MSRSGWDWVFQEGRVRSGGRPLRPGDAVSPGDVILLDLPGPLLGVLPALGGVRVVAEGSGWWFVDKPAGMHTVGQLPWENFSLTSAVAGELQKRGVMEPEIFSRLGEPPSLEGGLVQRLDFSTSGGVLVALNAAVKESFREMIRGRELVKTYLALVAGEFLAPRGEVVFHLADHGPSLKRVVDGSHPHTETVRLEFELLVQASRGALLRVTTRDGVRHVVRATLAALGHPIAGDEAYGGPHPLLASYPHHLLHAESLRWNEIPPLRCPVPSGFLRSLQHWEIDGGSLS